MNDSVTHLHLFQLGGKQLLLLPQQCFPFESVPNLFEAVGLVLNITNLLFLNFKKPPNYWDFYLNMI